MTREPSGPKRRATSLRMEPAELKRVKRIAVESDSTMVELMRRWITDGLEKAEARLAKKSTSVNPAPVENAAGA